MSEVLDQFADGLASAQNSLRRVFEDLQEAAARDPRPGPGAASYHELDRVLWYGPGLRIRFRGVVSSSPSVRAYLQIGYETAAANGVVRFEVVREYQVARFGEIPELDAALPDGLVWKARELVVAAVRALGPGCRLFDGRVVQTADASLQAPAPPDIS